MRDRMKIAILALIAVFGVALTSGAHAKIYQKHGYAVSGYDTVAYFTQGQPVEGNDSFVTEYKGAKWRFSSAENLETFKANPDKYAPQYGGHCAYAASIGSVAKGDPKQWDIHNGKLYLNLNAKVKARWVQDKDNYIATADKKWPELSAPKKKRAFGFN